MAYRLGVDVGTTYTAAAVFRDGAVSMLGLGNRAMQIPSVLCLKPDGTFLVGEASEGRLVFSGGLGAVGDGNQLRLDRLGQDQAL